MLINDIKKRLAPIYIAWMAFAAALGWIAERLFLAVLYYIIITPTGVIAKIFGKDFLTIKFDKKARSYWIKRPPSGQGPEHYEKQF